MLIAVSSAVAWLAAPSAAGPTVPDVGPVLPRYALVPGTHLIYEGSEVLASSNETIVERRAELRVVAADVPNRWRVIMTHRHQRFTGRGDARRPMPPREDLYVFVVGTDGTIADRAADSFGAIDRLLPQLPPDAAAAATGWGFDSADVRHRAGPVTGPAEDGAAWTFTVTPASHRDELSGFSATRTYRFDADRGLVVEITVDHRHEDRRTRTGHDRLVAVHRLDETEQADLAHDAELYLAAERSYRRQLADALGGATLAEAPARLESALAVLETARRAMRGDLLGARLDRMIAGHRASAGAHAGRLRAQARLIGHAAPDWTLVDLDGREHALAEYRGRVVVLDFWYRNCGWCIRAMPQLSRLAAEYADRPVAVLGMNVDRDIADARFVDELLDLSYPSLRADGRLAAAYAVRSYPTLVIVDREGIARYVHVGYSGTLTEELSRVIDGLLD